MGGAWGLQVVMLMHGMEVVYVNARKKPRLSLARAGNNNALVR
jgi:hypothetical protein